MLHGGNYMQKHSRNLTSIEIRSLMLDTLAYVGNDLDSEGKNFKMYDYQGSQQDLFRQIESLAIKIGLIPNTIPVYNSAWGGSGYRLHSGCTTNFSKREIIYIYEQFHLLLNQGIIAPGGINNGPDLPYFHVTDYGLKCLEEKEILPYDVDGYLDTIKTIPNISEWVDFYIKQALQCYNANCMEAALIMLGLSSEKIIEEQIDALSAYLLGNHPDKHSKMQGELLKARTASDKYLIFSEYFQSIKKKIPDQEFKDMLYLMDSVSTMVYTNFTRITRNELAHPFDIRMERIEVLMIFISFIKYCKTQYGFINYFLNN